MAAFQDILDFQFQATLGDGQAVRNTLHFRRNPSAGDVDATFLTALLADANTTTLLNAWRAMLLTTGRLDGVLARATKDPLFPNDDRDEAFRVEDFAGSHATAGDAAPDELGGLAKISGDLAGRRWRGRIWLPPVGNAGEVIGENYKPAGTYGVAVDAFRTQLLKTTYTSGAGHYGGQWNDVDLVVFSRKGRQLDETYYSRVPAIQMPRKLHWLRSRNPSSS
jgi:hypothetical protein